jgi:beta-lactamase class A
MSWRADLGEPAKVAVRTALEKLGDLCGCRVGMYAVGLEGTLAGVGFGVVAEDEAFPIASLIKVLVLAELLRQADSGLLSLADEVFVGPEDLVEPSGMRGCGGRRTPPQPPTWRR